MIWYYIIIAMFIGIIAGFGYYDVTKSELKLNYEMQKLVLMLRNTKRNAIFIGFIVGVVWPLALVILAMVLIFVSMSPNTINDLADIANEPKNVDLTNHNIVLDEQNEAHVIVMDDYAAEWIDLNEVNETKSDNIKTAESNTTE